MEHYWCLFVQWHKSVFWCSSHTWHRSWKWAQLCSCEAVIAISDQWEQLLNSYSLNWVLVQVDLQCKMLQFLLGIGHLLIDLLVRSDRHLIREVHGSRRLNLWSTVIRIIHWNIVRSCIPIRRVVTSLLGGWCGLVLLRCTLWDTLSLSWLRGGVLGRYLLRRRFITHFTIFISQYL